MNVAKVAEEIRAALKTIDGLNVVEWGVKRVHSPAAVVTVPERIEYDQTYGRGSDQLSDVTVLILVARPTEPESLRQVSAYCDGSGERSVKAAIDGHTYTTCDEVTVVWAEIDAVTYSGTEYLAALFHIDITGRGAA